MEPYRTSHKPPVSKVKVVNGSAPSTRSARHADLASNDHRGHDKDKHHVWPMNTHQSNGLEPVSPSTSLSSHTNGLSSFGFTSNSSTSNVIPSEYGPARHEFGGKPAFAPATVQYRIPNHRNADHEEAMDIDAQEDLHVDISSASQAKMTRIRNCNESEARHWKVLNTSKLNLVPPKEVKETASSPSTSSTSSGPVIPRANKGADKKKAIYIVLHVSDIMIGNLNAKASAPVKIYAEKLFLEIEFKDSSVLSLRLSCKDFSHCAVSFEPPKPVIIFTLTNQAMKVILNKNKVLYLDPNHEQDDVANRLVLHINYSKNGLPKTVKEDLIELFQKRMCNDIKWSELSSSEAMKMLGPTEKAISRSKATSSESCESIGQQSSVEAPSAARKILTPKKSRSVPKKPLLEEVVAESISQVGGETKTQAATPDEVLSDKIVTRSRRRKAEKEIAKPNSPPKMTATSKDDAPATTTNDLVNGQMKSDEKEDEKDGEPAQQGRDLLQHHSKMESHISLLGKHSEEQRHTLEHHQKLLSLERAQRTRSFERIQELQTTNHENQLCLIKQNETIDLLEREAENRNITIRQLQQELTQERESCSLMRKVQTDLVQARRDLDEEKVVRGLRDQQLQERQNELAEMRRLYTEESNSKRRVEEELHRTQNSCLQHVDELENLRLFRQTQEQELQGREERLQVSEQQYQDERAVRLSLEDQVRMLRNENDELRCSRDSAQTELTQERERRREESEDFVHDRQNYEQRIRESGNSLAECERRLQELQTTINNNSQSLLDDHRRIESRDWIIRREEVTISELSLGTGAWGSVKVGRFRSCQVAVKQIHELILSPHNRRLFEREMSIASRCRHPCLLQFIGATNDDGIPLFVTELLDTDLRAILASRSLHQEEIITIILDVARALNYLHLSKPFAIIHRDISSSNVLLWKRDTCWRAKLSDYGAANFMRQYMTVNPGAGIYAAPEASTSQQSPKVDIYSFGLLLCELCIRELPVPQQTQEQIALVTNGVLRELIIRCVRVDAEARPTMTEVITLLEQQQEHLLEHGLVSVNGRSAAL